MIKYLDPCHQTVFLLKLHLHFLTIAGVQPRENEREKQLSLATFKIATQICSTYG